ncbi:MAG: hypothetical protein GTO45_01795 [Candidatus Aminicenantes bacterium]|nr:hypothetical protein [Candidatus Aminicenantes bacterium]NIM77487.1 hypothetical protein [Candidatus Aminicenantes bacterium]NIN16795.1 hypothetical protein [Candidatus Aminicenantes bacterium]NIN40649.1 hypothetical protein [Candidatus Aminicenantes bacterium]NIN83474.1 hypothetical protein [Candidatus Aminicenantes bacterium]
MRSKFINIIQSNSGTIAKRWAKMVSNSDYTKTYRKLTREELIKLGKDVYQNLGRWLDPETSQAEIGRIYVDLGAKRYEQGYPLCEIQYVIHYHKRVLLNYIFSEGVLPDTLTLYRVTEFVMEINNFFDLAAFYVTRGFQETLYKKIIAQKGVEKERIKNIFPRGSFYYETEPDFRSFEKALEGFNLFKVK